MNKISFFFFLLFVYGCESSTNEMVLEQANALPISSTALQHAHAHNDYLHEFPLRMALSKGFKSIEVDVHEVDGELILAHTFLHRWMILWGWFPQRNLQEFYLDPLLRIYHEREQSLYANEELILLVDIKTDAEKTYALLKKVLEPYHAMLTRYESGNVYPNAIRILISGNRPQQTIRSESLRYVALDGRIEDITNKENSALMPLISANWKQLFDYEGEGTFPLEERIRLEKLVQTIHQQNKKLRFWNTPENLHLWKSLRKADVDLIGTDELDKLATFLEKQT